MEREKGKVRMGSEEEEEEEEANEAWKQALETFKEQALKMQSVSQETYEIYSKKALVTLKQTSEKLKIQAEKARNDLTEIAKEISKEGKVYLSTAAQNSPPEVKEIVQTFSSSADDFNDFSKVHDFHVGIPYGNVKHFTLELFNFILQTKKKTDSFLGLAGFILSVWGFLYFMLTGSLSAIRFGVILGGALLALSILSLKSYKRGMSSPLATNGQAGYYMFFLISTALINYV